MDQADTDWRELVIAQQQVGRIPRWSAAAGLGALAADYQRTLSVPADARGHDRAVMTCKRIASRWGSSWPRPQRSSE
ncbi:hypothetical protein ACH4VR_25460 [Streptomyces sp. NPDC020883]|uniref:hypothetical protein n=1 Tax=Streptomyces sp. NPDC020883 TaxID=3365099 RepID=UPI00379E811A